MNGTYLDLQGFATGTEPGDEFGASLMMTAFQASATLNSNNLQDGLTGSVLYGQDPGDGFGASVLGRRRTRFVSRGSMVEGMSKLLSGPRPTRRVTGTGVKWDKPSLPDPIKKRLSSVLPLRLEKSPWDLAGNAHSHPRVFGSLLDLRTAMAMGELQSFSLMESNG